MVYIGHMLKWLKELEQRECVKLITRLMDDNGLALSDIITDLHDQGLF